MEKKTILIVDDNDGIRSVYIEYLMKAGYSTKEARNGLEALAYLKDSSVPLLIILDLEMPEMNGLQFLAQQRKDLRLSTIPVLLNSGMGNIADLAGALGLPFIQKSCSQNEFLDKIRTILHE